MHIHNLPSVDEKNPLYCPAVSATAYLDSIRRHLHRGARPSKRSRNDQLLVSFTRVLGKALLSGDSDDDSDVFPPNPLVRSPSLNSSDDDTVTVNSRYSIPAWERFGEEDESYNPHDQWVGMRDNPLPPRPGRNGLKRKRSSFSDINGPSKYAKSIQSVRDSSFDITVRRENLAYSVPASGKKRLQPKVPPGFVGSGKASCRKTPRLVKDTSALLLKIRNLEGAQLSLK
jgi:hypothetical protein